MLRNAPETKPADSPREVVRGLADVVSMIEPRLLELWKTAGLTFAQRRVLRRLRDGPRSPGSLAAELGTSAPSLTRHLQKLEEGGLITRQIDTTDRRRVVVELTDAGRRSLAGHRVFGGSPLALAAAELSVAERHALVNGLGRLIALARAHTDE